MTSREPMQTVLVPGLMCSARLYAEQIPPLWRFGPVMVADHRRDESMEAIARRILGEAPPRFALVGLSMGGYIAFTILRQAPERVRALALLDTSARADRKEQAVHRHELIAMAQEGRYADVFDAHFPHFVHRNRRLDPVLRETVRRMAEETGPEAYVRQQRAILGRTDARDFLGRIRCPTLVLVGDGDELTPPKLSEEIAAAIPGARLTTVPDCGHLSTLERPEAVNAALTDWMADCRDSSAARHRPGGP
jgi:pimeloyl-ACP methyl ester carboxylesterase